MSTPTLIQHVRNPISYTIHDVVWVPKSARIVSIGSFARGTGAMKIMKLGEGKLTEIGGCEKSHGFRTCCMFGSGLEERFLATGDLSGRLSVWDLERLELPLWTAAAHQPGGANGMVNAVASCGGIVGGAGAAEIASCGSDGCVRVWDTRQEGPVASLVPSEGSADCWAVSFGDAHSASDRCVLSGWDNGDLKLFDLRRNQVRWETTLNSGICSIEFDRRDIRMNTCAVGLLEGKFEVFDTRTFNEVKGYAHIGHKGHAGTVWRVRHSPHNRDVFATCGGEGNISLWRYRYPSQRSRGEGEEEEGVAGTIERLSKETVSPLPVVAFDWSIDRAGLCAYGTLDGAVHVGIVTKINTV